MLRTGRPENHRWGDASGRTGVNWMSYILSNAEELRESLMTFGDNGGEGMRLTRPTRETKLGLE